MILLSFDTFPSLIPPPLVYLRLTHVQFPRQLANVLPWPKPIHPKVLAESINLMLIFPTPFSQHRERGFTGGRFLTFFFLLWNLNFKDLLLSKSDRHRLIYSVQLESRRAREGSTGRAQWLEARERRSFEKPGWCLIAVQQITGRGFLKHCSQLS